MCWATCLHVICRPFKFKEHIQDGLLQAVAAAMLSRLTRWAARLSECGCGDILYQGYAGMVVAKSLYEGPTIEAVMRQVDMSPGSDRVAVGGRHRARQAY